MGGGVWLPAGWSGNVGGGTERGVRARVAALQRGSAGRVAVSGRYPPGRVIRCRSRYPADRVTGTACYPCGRVTSGIRVTLQARRPGNPSAAVTLPARSPPPQGLPVAVSPPLQEQQTRLQQLLAIPMQRPHHPTRNPGPKLPCPGPWAPPRFGIPTGRPGGDVGGRPEDLPPLPSPPARPFRHRNPEVPHSLLE